MDKSAKKLTGLALACLAVAFAWTMLDTDEEGRETSPAPGRTISSAAVTVPAATVAVASGGRALVRDLARFSPQLYRIVKATEQAHAEVQQLRRRNQESSSASL